MNFWDTESGWKKIWKKKIGHPQIMLGGSGQFEFWVHFVFQKGTKTQSRNKREIVFGDF